MYGSGGGAAAGCGDCVTERAEAAARAAVMVQSGEAQTLAAEAIEKAGYERHASETLMRSKAVSAEAF